MYAWGAKSLTAYITLHPDLQLLCNTVLLHHDCSILYGHRNKKLQNSLYTLGHSKLRYPKSKHNSDPSNAVDLLPYRKGYNPYGSKKELAYGKYFCGLVNGIASMLYDEGKIEKRIVWGGSWSVQRDAKLAGFYDGYHWERE